MDVVLTHPPIFMKERKRMPTINRSRPGLGFVAAMIAVALLAAACEGSSDASSGVATVDEGQEAEPGDGNQTAPLDDEDAQALVFAECVRDNGVDMPDPGPGQQGLIDAFRAIERDYDRATLNQALSACQDLMPQYGQEHPTGDDWQLDLAECLRKQGLDVSDTPFEDAHSGAIDVNEFAAAMEVCRNELAGGQ
ncbi:MAG: hypothetical protein GEU74_15005 [Nitriliruptorales bacterium]|nr:hypothetical protein [Nitriliruptorales bacterium]